MATLVGQNYTTPDLVAKVTGAARYAEDFRAEGMLFCKLLLSPMPHCRVRRLDTAAALAAPGVKAILTADDLPPVKAPEGGVPPERALTLEPVYQGEPILAIAAVDETTAAHALELIEMDLEPLPFVVDPIASLRPGGPNARLEGNALVDGKVTTLKWTADDFATAPDGALPLGAHGRSWAYGDVDAAFAEAALVLDETFHTPSTHHQPLETRSAMAYWRNGTLYLHGSTQSVSQTRGPVAAWVGVPEDQVVIVSEYTGGGFGSKIPGAHSMAIPALLAKKANAPVMMRITREEEHYIGRTRPNLIGRAKVGFARDGRILGVDLFVLQDAGPYEDQYDIQAAPDITSLAYQPQAMRFRGLSVLTNTPPRTSQRNPGGMQANAVLEPILAKAARQLGIDSVVLHRLNAPAGKALYGAPRKDGTRGHVTSAFVAEAIDKGAALFDWTGRRTRSQVRRGPKRRGVGMAVSPFLGGYSVGYDGLLLLKPDGRLYVQSGNGNLGTHSVIDTARVPAEMIGIPWEQVTVTWGDTSKHLPWTCTSDGSQTIQAVTRANHAAARDLLTKLQELAALELGGAPGDYRVADGRVSRGGGRGLTFAEAATRAVARGGRFDGHELPADIHAMTKASATALAGQGLMGVAKDNYPHDGDTHSYVVGFAEVEVDVETGNIRLVEYTAVADVGTVINPRGLAGQILGGSCLGIGHALTQRAVYDQQYGVALARRFHHNKPLTIMDIPADGLHPAALDIADPDTPVGARGVGEPPVGAGYGAVLAAIADALGDDMLHRSPITPDRVLTALAKDRHRLDVLTSHV